MLVEAHQAGIDAKAMQQQAAVAGVFAGDAINAGQHLLRPRREITAMTNGGAHQIQHPGCGLRTGSGVLHNGQALLSP